MSQVSLRIWFMVTFTLALGAVVVRLVWEVTSTTSVVSLTILALVILTIVGIYALILYLIIKPSLKKIKALPVGIGVIGLFTAGLIGTIIHYIRFVPSPEADPPLSVVIATLLLVAAISSYVLLLWVVWSSRSRSEGTRSLISK